LTLFLRMKGLRWYQMVKCEIPAPVEPTSQRKKEVEEPTTLCVQIGRWTLLPRPGQSPKPFLHPHREPLVRRTILPSQPSELAADESDSSAAGQQDRPENLFSSDAEHTLLPKPGHKLTVLSGWRNGNWLLPETWGGKGMVGKGVSMITKYFKKTTLYWVCGEVKGAFLWFGNRRAKNGGII